MYVPARRGGGCVAARARTRCLWLVQNMTRMELSYYACTLEEFRVEKYRVFFRGSLHATAVQLYLLSRITRPDGPLAGLAAHRPD